jgi:hypothetical protein
VMPADNRPAGDLPHGQAPLDGPVRRGRTPVID